mgnify:CR=1 FL=1
MKSLGSLIQSKAQQSQILRGALSAQVVEAANLVLQNFFGEEIVDQARAVYLKGRVLTNTCLSLTAARDIRISEGRIINEINKRFDNLQVEKIRYLA